MNKYLAMLEGDRETQELLKKILIEKSEGKKDKLFEILDDLFEHQMWKGESNISIAISKDGLNSSPTLWIYLSTNDLYYEFKRND